MKRYFTFILCCISVISLSAQSMMTVEDLRTSNIVQADRDMERYVWAIGYGIDVESADQNALNALSQTSMVRTTVVDNKIENVVSGGAASSTVGTKVSSVATASIYMENVKRIVLQDADGQKRVLRYMTRADWDNRESKLKEKIEHYIENGEMMTTPEDILRCYSWAHALLRSYSKEDITVEGISAREWLLAQMRSVLDDIKISVIGAEQDKDNKNYPYTLFLDFVYKGDPLSNITFSYFDGSGMVDGQTVKDGRGMVSMKKLPDNFNINIDCNMIDLARQLDPTVAVLLPTAPVFDGSVKSIETTPKGVKPRETFDSTSSKIASAVTESLAKSESSYAAVEAPIQTETYTKIMTDVVSSFSKLSNIDTRQHFTDDAWEDYQKIVLEGNPTIARTPEWKFMKLDTLVLCRAIPLKLKFSGNKSFIEDVVFRINANTNKVESVAYKLSAKTEKEIMEKQWEERDRLTLITFLEDYRTAYCLRDMSYIKKVFSDDAYIIVGKVLQQSKKKYDDKTELINTDGKAVYTRLSKKEYLTNLQKSFASKEFVNIRFEECDVEKGYNAKAGIYAVQVRQLYYSNNYADDGILTLAIDMRKEANPLVRVRVWQQQRDVDYTAEQMIERTVSTDSGID